MRLFLALGLALIVGLGAAFRPGDNLPGREAGVAESSRVVGGGAAICTIKKCGASVACLLNSCQLGGGTADTCNVNCKQDCGCGGE